MNEQKKRHGCLTVYLVLMLIASLALVLTYTLSGAALMQNYPNAPVWALPALTIGAILNVVFVIALFRWNKWGFWGMVAVWALGFIVNLQLGITVVATLFSLLGLAILFGVLQLGKENKGWSRLK